MVLHALGLLPSPGSSRFTHFGRTRHLVLPLHTVCLPPRTAHAFTFTHAFTHHRLCHTGLLTPAFSRAFQVTFRCPPPVQFVRIYRIAAFTFSYCVPSFTTHADRSYVASLIQFGLPHPHAMPRLDYRFTCGWFDTPYHTTTVRYLCYAALRIFSFTFLPTHRSRSHTLRVCYWLSLPHLRCRTELTRFWLHSLVVGGSVTLYAGYWLPAVHGHLRGCRSATSLRTSFILLGLPFTTLHTHTAFSFWKFCYVLAVYHLSAYLTLDVYWFTCLHTHRFSHHRSRLRLVTLLVPF